MDYSGVQVVKMGGYTHILEFLCTKCCGGFLHLRNMHMMIMEFGLC
jgi:hypothetical protein